MNRIDRAHFAALLAVGATLSASQLPPEIELDRHLLQAEQQIERDEFGAAFESLQRIVDLEEKHSLEVPGKVLLMRARVLAHYELHDEAIKALGEYLTSVGRNGEHYREALLLLNQAEAAKAAAAAVAEEARRSAEAARRRMSAARAAAEEARKKAETLIADVIAGDGFVWIPPGEFRMGSNSFEARDDERPRRRVRISRGFYLGRHQVTEELWRAVMGAGTDQERGSVCDQCPVGAVSWDDAQAFIAKLNEREGGKRFRLPTEAEWEYAARAGTTGDRYGELDAIAWYDETLDGKKPVGQKAPNAWGLYDMLGNMGDWVADWYGPYRGGRVTDPTGPNSGKYRVYRGCWWLSDAIFCRVSCRSSEIPSDSRSIRPCGFRLAKNGT